jgi:hypothetical protein
VNAEPYYAYIASTVRPDWYSTNEMGYEKVLEMAREANDAEAIESLESIQFANEILAERTEWMMHVA